MTSKSVRIANILERLIDWLDRVLRRIGNLSANGDILERIHNSLTRVIHFYCIIHHHHWSFLLDPLDKKRSHLQFSGGRCTCGLGGESVYRKWKIKLQYIGGQVGYFFGYFKTPICIITVCNLVFVIDDPNSKQTIRLYNYFDYKVNVWNKAAVHWC